MVFQRSAHILGSLCVLGFLGMGPAEAQSLTELAAKEKERRKKAGTTEAPAFSNDDLRKLPDSAEANPDRAADDKSRPARATTPTDGEARSESWWRSRAKDCREEIADAEQQVKYYEARLEEARTGIRQPQPGDATRQLPPTRIATDYEKRAAEAGLALAQRSLAAAKKQMEDLEDEARKKQILPGWLR